MYDGTQFSDTPPTPLHEPPRDLLQPHVLPTGSVEPPSKKPRRKKAIIIAIIIIATILLISPLFKKSESSTINDPNKALVPESTNDTVNPSITLDQNSYTAQNRNQLGSVKTDTRLGLPVSGTVLALPGMDFQLKNTMPDHFQGLFSKSPYTYKLVDYPRNSSSKSISTGITNLDAAIKKTPGMKIILAYSQGAQVASGWMRLHANDPKAPKSDELVFVLSGNPLRSTGGYGIGRPTWDGSRGVATPTDTPWHIIDVARRYDGWADWVADTDNRWAVDNANAGKISTHSRYNEVNIHDPTSTIWSYGNTTYVLTQEELPMWRDKDDTPASVVSAMKAHIETAYKRPRNDQKVTITPTTDWYWNLILKAWGVPQN